MHPLSRRPSIRPCPAGWTCRLDLQIWTNDEITRRLTDQEPSACLCLWQPVSTMLCQGQTKAFQLRLRDRTQIVPLQLADTTRQRLTKDIARCDKLVSHAELQKARKVATHAARLMRMVNAVLLDACDGAVTTMAAQITLPDAAYATTTEDLQHADLFLGGGEGGLSR